MTQATPDLDRLRASLTRLGLPVPEDLPGWYERLTLRGGKGTGKEGDRCSLQEVRALEGLDASSDEVPGTDSYVVGRALIRLQDAIKDDVLRKRLCGPLVVRLPGSRGSAALESRRRWMAVDWALRVEAPRWMDLEPALAEHAARLRSLPELRNQKGADAAWTIVDAARAAAWKVRSERLDAFRARLREEPAVAAAAAAVAAAVVAAVVAAAAEAAVVAAVAAAEAVEAEAVEAVEAEAVEAEAAEPFDVQKSAAKAARDAVTARLKPMQESAFEAAAAQLARMLDVTEADL